MTDEKGANDCIFQMTQKKTIKNGPALVIVESPAKAKTIGKYLGPDFIVEASVGHIRDLPKGAKEIPEKYKREPWSRLGVNVDSKFEPIYIVPAEKTKQIKKLKDLLKNASALYLATDEDREGEAISWHLSETLQPNVPVYRLVFHEITKTAIVDALEHPRSVNEDLVGAQETRRILDRLYGYEVSPLLWYKIRTNLSAGRVQSVAVRLIVERERDRMAFKNAVYWDVLGAFSTNETHSFQATLTSVDGKHIPSGKDFNPANGLLNKPEKFILLDESSTNTLIQQMLNAGDAKVESVDEKPYTTRPYPPFTTSALQQEANRKLGFTAKRTMSVAQSLYENGYITYMRTDSTNLSQEAINAARTLVQTHYGIDFLPEKPRYYQTKVKNAQEAHEAIRPAGNAFPLPEDLRTRLSADEYRLYDLIWKRTIASQMKDAFGKRKTIVVSLDVAKFQVGGKTIEFPGYLRAYVEGKDDPNAELDAQETILPDVKQGDLLHCDSLKPQEHTTTPPQRFSEASLTKTLEDKGIGRPSTYASIIDLILNRNYVFKKNGALVPTWTAFAVCKLLETHFPVLVDYSFTADMENELDEISRGERNRFDYLRAFYYGDPATIDVDLSQVKLSQDFPFPISFAPGLKTLIQNKIGEIDAREVSKFFIGTPKNEDGTEGEPIYLRVGRYGPFLEQGDSQTSVGDDTPPDELTLEAAIELFNSAKQSDAPLGICPETGKPIYLKHGRYGWYVQRGENDDEDKQNASLLPNMQNGDVNLNVAIGLLSLPKTLGVDPEHDDMPVQVFNGRFGPYVKRGAESRSLPKDVSPLEITFEQALELLAAPKYGGRATAKKSEPLMVFEKSPVTNVEIKLMNGRFGPYVTDGETNASLPKDMQQEDLTFEYALELLANRAAKGAAPRRKKSTKSAKKTAEKKKTTDKKTTVEKKTATKKTAEKKKATDNPEDAITKPKSRSSKKTVKKATKEATDNPDGATTKSKSRSSKKTVKKATESQLSEIKFFDSDAATVEPPF